MTSTLSQLPVSSPGQPPWTYSSCAGAIDGDHRGSEEKPFTEKRKEFPFEALKYPVSRTPSINPCERLYSVEQASTTSTPLQPLHSALYYDDLDDSDSDSMASNGSNKRENDDPLNTHYSMIKSHTTSIQINGSIATTVPLHEQHDSTISAAPDIAEFKTTASPETIQNSSNMSSPEVDTQRYEKLLHEMPKAYENLHYHAYTGIDLYVRSILGQYYILLRAVDPVAELPDFKDVLAALTTEQANLAKSKGYHWDFLRDWRRNPVPGTWRSLDCADTVAAFKEDPNGYETHNRIFKAIDEFGSVPSAWSSAVALKGKEVELRTVYQFDTEHIPLLMRVYARKHLSGKNASLALDMVEMARAIDLQGRDKK